ncbi:long-chain fatty acid--CoA ligase [Pandoraea terrae]|uniref:Long-chain fatty acid--CoA ligase n=1 Tax=Pandoraea terrae TaxID=1537710 RepID=A0A5E4S7Y8_9BURK|nr:AMP-binding protein [Pandoraea terrae]VVD71193.1 long-chain fatty acid--CoA ligase [Pandoraea terrae]
MHTPDSHALIVHRGPGVPFARFQGTTRSAGTFLADVERVAARLPAAGEVFNACQNRYWFAVVFAACALRARMCVLPAASTAENIAHLRHDYPHLHFVSERDGDSFGLPAVRLGIEDLAPEGAACWPPSQLPSAQKVVRLFTSGSTGRQQGHDKHWGELAQATLAGLAGLGLDETPGFAALGTVPPQHMYGLESTVLRPMLGGGVLTDACPFYPADVAAALASLPAPRVLVSTPFHLRTLLDSDVALPELALVTSATAPLSPALAARLEAYCKAPLLEIYGSTETGQLATRRSASAEQWTCLAGISLQAGGTERAMAAGGHLRHAQLLGDRVALIDARHFRLLGRTADLVNVAGKRSSLDYLTQQLLAIPGVEDGVFFLPEENDVDAVVRVAALVVAPGLTRAKLLAQLRCRIDPVFLPRPLKFVTALPRNVISKLPLDRLRAALVEEAVND